MQYYVYFDAYGHPRKAIDATELAAKYDNNPDVFLRAACQSPPENQAQHISGHVGTLNFDSAAELERFFESLGDEIAGFYDAGIDARPYNF